MKTETRSRARVRCFEPTARFDGMTRIGNVFVRPDRRGSVASPAAAAVLAGGDADAP